MHDKLISNYDLLRVQSVRCHNHRVARVLWTLSNLPLERCATHAELFFCIRTVKNPNSS